MTPGLGFHMAFIVLVLASVPLRNVPHRHSDVLMEVPFTQEKWHCPYKSEISGLWHAQNVWYGQKRNLNSWIEELSFIFHYQMIHQHHPLSFISSLSDDSSTSSSVIYIFIIRWFINIILCHLYLHTFVTGVDWEIIIIIYFGTLHYYCQYYLIIPYLAFKKDFTRVKM